MRGAAQLPLLELDSSDDETAEPGVNEPVTKVRSFRSSNPEWDLFQDAADAAGAENRNQWIRDALVDAARKALDSASSPVAAA